MEKSKETIQTQTSSESHEIEIQQTRIRFKRVIISAGILAICALIINFLNLIEIASILAIAAALLVLFAFTLWLLFDLKTNIKSEKVSLKNFGIAALLLIGLIGAFLLFLTIVSQIDWFNYYIVNAGEGAYNIYGFIVPQLHLKLVVTIFSGLAFFLITMVFDFRSIDKGLEEAYKQNKTLLEIFFVKDEFDSKYSSRIVYKSSGFIIAIGFAMIPYTIEGFTIIIPFGLAFLGPFILIFLIVRYFHGKSLSKARDLELLLEETKRCGNCKKRALASAKFCGECGKPFKMQYEIHETMKFCPECNGINPHNYTFCRHCGFDFTSIVRSEKVIVKRMTDFLGDEPKKAQETEPESPSKKEPENPPKKEIKSSSSKKISKKPKKTK